MESRHPRNESPHPRVDLCLPVLYCPPVSWFVAARQAAGIILGLPEPYRKQTYRNRCAILTANGKMTLTVPVHKSTLRTAFTEVRIDHSKSWGRLHWRALTSAYNRSPFFLYYQDALHPFFHESTEISLYQYNLKLINKLFELLGWGDGSGKCRLAGQDKGCDESAAVYLPSKDGNGLIAPDLLEPYTQVFLQDKGFLPDLSILDLLFNLGPESLAYLERQGAVISDQ